MKKPTHSFAIKLFSVSSGKQSVVFVKPCLVPKEPSRNERYFFSCSAVGCIFSVQHSGDQAQQAGDFKAALKIADD